MVAPAWGTFQKPETTSNELEEEYSQEVPGEIKDTKAPQGEKPQWGNFQTPDTFQGEPDPTADEGMFSYLTRNLTANASRLAEQVLGKYGNTEKFLKDILTSVPELGGPILWGISKLVGPEKWERIVRGPPGQQQMIPTSETLKKVSQEVSGGYTKPKTPGEKKFQEYTEDVGAVLTARTPANLTGMGAGRRAFQIASNKFLIPAAANVAKEITKDLGFGEDAANWVKLGVWLPLSLANNVNAPAYASNLMNQARNEIPANLQTNVPRFLRELDAIERTLLSSDPRTALARQAIAGLRNDIANGQTSVRSFMTMYDAVNAAKRSRGLFELGRRDQNFARRAINNVRDVLRDEIVHSSGGFPEAVQNWRNGIQAWATVHRSNAISNWIKNIAKGPYAKFLSSPAAALFGVGSYAGFKHPLVATTLGLGAATSYKTGQVLYRILNNPQLSDYYWRAIGAATEENLPAFISNYEKLNKELEKSEPVNPNSKTKK